MKGFIVHPDYYADGEGMSIHLFGRLENGQSFMTINKFEPYFYVKKSDAKKVEKLLLNYKVEESKLRNFSGDSVIKISSKNSTEILKLYKAIYKITEVYEADIKPHYKFLIDNNLLGTINIEGDYEPSERIDRVYKEPKIIPADFIPKLKVLSIDTESSKETGELFCIGIYGENYRKVLLITDKKIENAESCKDESECLEKFKKEILKLDPDIITGWSVIDFDLNYLQERFRKNKISFDIGRTNQEARIKIESNFFRASSAKIPGRQILDGLNLIKDPFLQQSPIMRNAKFESYTLEDVSQEILKTGKSIKGLDRHKKIEESFRDNQKKLVEYNILDCKLVYDILEKTNLIEIAVERSKLTGMPLDRISASIIAFDSLYIREAHKRGIASPTTKFGNKEEKIKGGYVYSSKPGIYKNVLIFDFKSLYPSVIRTFNIDPASHLARKEKDSIESPNKQYFANNEGILPRIIEKLHEAREKTKKEKNELANYAIKTIMNSFWGVLASPNCRYFNLDMANAITSFCRELIQLTAKKIEERGYKVIYQDTDSSFVETNLEKSRANELGKELQDYINNFYREYINEKYKRKSFLELQFDKQYIFLMIPRLRMQKDEEEKAAKKRYAGLIEKNGGEELEITGLEAIRGDWTDAAREFQRELIMRAFHGGEIGDFVKDYIKKKNSGKMDEKLVYRKSIRKSLHQYTKSTPPHVKAARQLDNIESRIIEYYITIEGPEPIQKLKHKIDYEHYIEKQIKPIANQILALFDKSFDDLVKGTDQTTLF